MQPDSGGGVKLGNMARIMHDTSLPTSFEDGMLNINTNLSGYIKIGDNGICVVMTRESMTNNGIYSIADGATIEFATADMPEYPIESGPVDACIMVATGYTVDGGLEGGAFTGEILPYDGIVYDADKAIMTIPIHDIPETFISSVNNEEFVPIIKIKYDKGGIS